MFIRPPLVSIITVTYNNAYHLEGTVRSVLMQTYPHIEHIIIDGSSADHTATVLQLMLNANNRLLNSKILRWISEPDKGLYNAMNKGLRMATGDFVWFLNAGDHLMEPETVEKVMMQCAVETDVLYGEVMLTSFARQHLGVRSALTAQKLPETLTWKSLRQGMVVCHQAFVARRTLAPFYREDNLTADIDWVIQILKKSRGTLHTHLILAEYLVGGVSKQKHWQSLKDRYVVLKQHYGYWPNILAHLGILWRAFFSDAKY